MLFTVWGPLSANAEDILAGAEADRFFTLKVKPLLSEKCLSCHGDDPDEVESGFNMLTRKSLLAGGDNYTDVVVPGDSSVSLLMDAIRWKNPDLEMPPKENDRLTAAQIKILRDWIDAGVHWPDNETQERIRRAEKQRSVTDEGIIVHTSGALSPDWAMRRYQPEDLWAFKRVESIERGGHAHPIDAFVSEKLAETNLQPARPASPRTLVRRISFDLTGLPPSPAMVKDFLESWRLNPESAYVQLVDELLDSPHYGERQAQYWLDVTRYADTSGGSNDYERSGVWRYRDYVVRSFNADRPYDAFVREQIAGDLLNPVDPEGAVAVGFLRMGPWEATNMTVAALVRQQFLDDVVNHVGETFLAQPLRCAKCHDHKFDPIPTMDYYRIMSVFEHMNQAEIPVPFAPGEVVPDAKAERERIGREVDRATAEMVKIDRVKFRALVAWLVERGYDASEFEFGTGKKRPREIIDKDFPEGMRPSLQFGLSADQITLRSVYSDRRAHFTRYLERYEPVAYTVYDGPPNDYYSSNRRNPIPTDETERKNDPIHILNGGDLASPGERVLPGALSCVDALAGHGFELENANRSPRIEFAEWISHPENPLTARVIVNRIWQQHFGGNGIVATPSNFGYTGARPSHPRLLDYLANWFVENGWSLKKLHRLVVTSEAYRRSARHSNPQSVATRDPNRILLAAYPVRRLHAEEMRDAMLSISGELNRQMGGPPVFPEMNLEAAMQPRYLQIAVGPAYQPSPTPEERHRRTIYAFRMRGLSNPFLEVFNKPSADFSCESRDATTVTPQVFSLFNGQQPHDRSLALARRLENFSSDGNERINYAYELVYGRPAEPEEIRRALRFIDAQTQLQIEHPPERVDPPITVKRSMVHEQTGVRSTWEEYLDVYDRSFVPDLKPWDVGPETRALAAFCLVLFNSNEFLYIE